MPGYQFTSNGASAYDNIVKFMAQRQALQRQVELDALNKRNVESQMADRETNRKLQEATMKDVSDNRDFTHAKDIADMAGGEETASPEAEALLTKTGFGGRLDKKYTPGTPGIGVLAMDQLPPNAVPGVTQTTIKPGAAYEKARVAATEKADLAKTTAQDKADAAATAAAQRDTDKKDAFDREANLRRELQNNSIRASADNAALGRQVRTDAAADKKAESDKKDELARDDTHRWAESSLGELDKLLTEDGKLTPGMQYLTGTSHYLHPDYIPFVAQATGAGDAAASLDRLKSRLAIDLMRQMKSQSRTGATGFGQLSERELDVLMNAAGRFNASQSEGSMAEALTEIRSALKRTRDTNALKSENPATGGGTNEKPAGHSVGYVDDKGVFHRN